MSRLSDEMLMLLINASTHELRNSMFYSIMANHLGVRGFTNSSKFCKKQISEEQEHFEKVWQYISDRNAKAMLGTIPQIIGDFSDLRIAFDEALKLEFSTTEMWQDILAKATEEGDYITQRLAHEYMDIQRVEENEFMTIVDEISLIGENLSNQKLWDNTYEF